MLPFRKILVPTDFTGHSISAFHIAAALARDHGASLLVLHVREIPTPPFAQFGAAPIPETDAQRVFSDRLEQFQLNDSKVATECVLVDGDPSEEIVRAAADRDCDLIVMGTHGRTGLGSLVMGSVALEVMRKAPCPVLTVKHPLAAAEESWPGPKTAPPSGDHT
jgi:nucleotide-binding universal stress UspA family protein